MQAVPLSHLALRDKRLNTRCNQLIAQLVQNPTESIPEACGTWKTTKAAYRFFSNEHVHAEQIMHAQYQETQDRIQATEGIILVAQDTTDLDYSTHPRTQGLGYLQGERLFGMKMHSALAIDQRGVPLGVLAQTRWIRDMGTFGKRRMKGREKRPIEEKESHRWLTTVQSIEKSIPAGKKVIVIGDREADMYELFAMKRAPHIDLLVRAKTNRYLWGTNKRLFEKVHATPVAGLLSIRIEKAGYRRERVAQLSIRYTPVTLASKKGTGAIKLWVVTAEETQPPTGVQPLKWILLTTVPVTSYKNATEVLTWYTRRWVIERFHYTLKSGCRIEELQLQERDRLERAVALYTVVAWRLLWMTYKAREYPEGSVSTILSKEEVMVLSRVSKKRTITTIREGVRQLAKLGGFLARKGDKDPGVKTLWLGIRRFHDIMEGWRLAKKKDVGKG